MGDYEALDYLYGEYNRNLSLLSSTIVEFGRWKKRTRDLIQGMNPIAKNILIKMMLKDCKYTEEKEFLKGLMEE